MAKKTTVASATHIHRFKRHTYKSTGTSVFICILDDCYFKTQTELTLGKRSICNRCGNPFTMNEYSIRLAKPHCSECHEHRGDRKKNKGGEILKYGRRANDVIKGEVVFANNPAEPPNRVTADDVEKSMIEDTVSNLRSRLDQSLRGLPSKNDDEGDI